MGWNIFTSYIIRNRLNLETFFEPIIDFIEIGGTPPLRTVYETFISYSSSKNTQILVATDITEIIQSLKLLNPGFNLLWRYEETRQIRKLFFVAIVPKYQVGSVVFILILTCLLNPLFPYIFLFDLFSLLLIIEIVVIELIGILLLRPYESIQTSDSY